MSGFDTFLQLPAELACEIVGQWLCLKDIVRLDSAFCHDEKRSIVHESIFQSPLCIIADSNYSCQEEIELYRWVLFKRVRLSYLHITKPELQYPEEYLRECGPVVESAFCSGYCVPSGLQLALIAKHCRNLRVLDLTHCAMTQNCIDLLKSCVHLESIKTKFLRLRDEIALVYPSFGTHHLKLTSIDSDCRLGEDFEKFLLGVCCPQSVQRLKLRNMQLPDWKLYINLRSLAFNHTTAMVANGTKLARICTLCPWIVNLEVSSEIPLTDDIVVPAIRALKHLRTLNIEFQPDLTDAVLYTLAEHHKHTLEALYIYSFNCQTAMTACGINHVLRECTKLRTFSFTPRDGIDYSLMGNITKIVVGHMKPQVWNQLGRFCHGLQHLHVAMDNLDAGTTDAIIAACSDGLVALRTVCFSVCVFGKFPDLVQKLRLELPLVRIIKEQKDDWYHLFDLPV